MYLLIAEMFLALGIIVFIMWWTMKDAVQSDNAAQKNDKKTKLESTDKSPKP